MCLYKIIGDFNTKKKLQHNKKKENHQKKFITLT